METTFGVSQLISIDLRLFDSLVRRIDTLVKKAELLDRRDRDMKLSNWLDNEDVCGILGVNKRTLHIYRRKGILPYHQMRYKVYYRPEDVQQLLESSRISKEDKT